MLVIVPFPLIIGRAKEGEVGRLLSHFTNTIRQLFEDSFLAIPIMTIVMRISIRHSNPVALYGKR